MRLLRAARLIASGGLLAHPTSTIAGVAAHPSSPQGIMQLQHFKQRRGPFLLLSDSRKTAMRLARHIPPALRQFTKEHWPGRTTIIYAARPGLPGACYNRGRIAVRVDADEHCLYLAKRCGGLLLSSSLNRKGGATARPERRQIMRWHRYIRSCFDHGPVSGKPSALLCIMRNRVHRLR